LSPYDDRVVAIIVGHVAQDLPLVRELVAQVAPDHLDRRLDGAEHVGQLLKVRAPCLTSDLLRGDCHHPPVWPRRRATSRSEKSAQDALGAHAHGLANAENYRSQK